MLRRISAVAQRSLAARVAPRLATRSALRLPVAHGVAPVQLEARRFAATAGGKAKRRGVLDVDSLNLEPEVIKSSIPTLLYFHATSHPTVKDYSDLLAGKVDELNSAAAHRATSEDGTASGSTAHVLKLAMVNVEREPALAQQFQVTADAFPLIYFIYNGQVCDKMVGVVQEAQVVDAVAAFLRWVDEEGRAAQGRGEKPTPVRDGGPKPDRMDDDEENVVTLLQVALRKTQEKDFAKATELFTRCRNLADAEVQKLKERMGVTKKKMTPEIQERLKKDPHYNALPQAVCGLAMAAMGQKKFDEAYDFCQVVRRDYAWAIRDLRQVGDTMARVEMIKISGYDVDKDSYVTLLKRDDLVDDPVAFYQNNVKLAVAHYYERHPEMAIEELLKLIRVEQKLMPALKKSGVTEGLSAPGASPQNATPARRVLFLVFEALGNSHQAVVDARRKMAAFLYA